MNDLTNGVVLGAYSMPSSSQIRAAQRRFRSATMHVLPLQHGASAVPTLRRRTTSVTIRIPSLLDPLGVDAFACILAAYLIVTCWPHDDIQKARGHLAACLIVFMLYLSPGINLGALNNFSLNSGANFSVVMDFVANPQDLVHPHARYRSTYSYERSICSNFQDFPLDGASFTGGPRFASLDLIGRSSPKCDESVL